MSTRVTPSLSLILAGSSALALGMCIVWPQWHLPSYDYDTYLFSWLIGIFVGTLFAILQWHPSRRLGLVPLGWSLLVLVTLGFFTRVLRPHEDFAGMILGAGTALAALPPWLTVIQRTWRDGPGGYLLRFLPVAVLTCYSLAAASMLLPKNLRPGLLLAAAVLGATLAWIFLFRAFLEATLEVLFWPMYNIRAHGPGVRRVPYSGPVLIVCNHTAYADPFWLGKVIPRYLRPLMLSVFYDLPGIAWIMRNLVRAIRVPMTPFRRTAPELDEAATGLARGDCIVIFPEGRLRRRADVLLGPIGQGVWRILKEVPHAQVVCVWIEGGWGSFSSYDGGPPMRGKGLDFRRTIDIAIAYPVTMPPEVLASQEATRAELRRAILACRTYLGLNIPLTDIDEPQESANGGLSEDVHENNPQ